jgi:hypothetical protein
VGGHPCRHLPRAQPALGLPVRWQLTPHTIITPIKGSTPPDGLCRFKFRVRAMNLGGWGEMSPDTEVSGAEPQQLNASLGRVAWRLFRGRGCSGGLRELKDSVSDVAWQFIKTREKHYMSIEDVFKLKAKAGARAILRLMEAKKHM